MVVRRLRLLQGIRCSVASRGAEVIKTRLIAIVSLILVWWEYPFGELSVLSSLENAFNTLQQVIVCEDIHYV